MISVGLGTFKSADSRAKGQRLPGHSCGVVWGRVGSEGGARGYDFDNFAEAFRAYIHQAENPGAEGPGEAGCVACDGEADKGYTGAERKLRAREGGEA